ncbi:molecular chaperone TorD family protein [Thalassotalea ponticola]|uniref:TorD/DmsD family molecular chaperone n=1 Tax=Thalassotalea ponticola TaxID=1523392 RepID=UPI0025B626AA|nr:molecular chaperone TorD family protein [Thalassotalea ponticola]MDN3653961.1 molecular chaperone TorD family protein [Thalassotalea ponticola]
MALPTESDSFRRDVYLLLAALLRDAPKAELLELLGSLDVDLQQADNRQLLTAFLQLKQEANKASPTQLNDAYFNLFIGLSFGDIYLYAGWYNEQKLMSHSLAKLRHYLSTIGFTRQTEIKEPEDHISALCEVMAILIDNDSQHQQLVFFEQFVGTWYDGLCQALIDNQISSFYANVGRVMRAFLQQEKALFERLNVAVSQR